MKSLPAKISDYFLSHPEGQEFYKASIRGSSKMFSFFTMQITRFIVLWILFFVWCANFYINVKKCVIYLNFWSSTFTLLAYCILFTQSGRLVVEKKLEAKGDLEEKEKSDWWKTGFALYHLAWPFSITSTVLFAAIVSQDQICQTYYDFGFEEWRAVVITLATYITPIILLVDFFMNKLRFTLRHLVLNLFLIGLYFLATIVGQASQNRPIYGNNLGYWVHQNFNWADSETQYANDTWALGKIQECKDHFNWTGDSIQPDWSKTGTTIGVIIGTLIASHVVLYFLSNWKAGKHEEVNEEKREKLIQNEENKQE